MHSTVTRLFKMYLTNLPLNLINYPPTRSQGPCDFNIYMDIVYGSAIGQFPNQHNVYKVSVF